METANGSGAVNATVSTLSSLLPRADEPLKRADSIALKIRLASLLPPVEGQRYWLALVDFMTGKINRAELSIVLKRVLSDNTEAVNLHNALLMSILYNTTRPILPPAAVRNSGWHKRKRDKSGNKIQDRDPKRQRIKQAVMAIGKRERAELKMLGLGPKRELEMEREAQLDKRHAQATSLQTTLRSRGLEVGKDGLPLALADVKQPPATLSQDYMRCLQAPLCAETRMLPDLDSLRDRMSLLAYDSGLMSGADSKVALLGAQALDVYLKAMISGAISLVRSPGSSTNASGSSAALGEEAAKVAVTPTTTFGQASDVAPTRHGNDISQPATASTPRDPLRSFDFGSLFEISPGLLARARFAAVERLYASSSADTSDASDSEAGSEHASDAEDAKVVATQERAPPPTGKYPRLSRQSSSIRSGRPGSRSNSLSKNVPSSRQHFVIDPSAVAIPAGHPDVAQTQANTFSVASGGSANTESSVARQNGSGDNSRQSTAQTPQLSPKSLSLRQQLFPELEQDNSGDTNMQAPQSPHNNTSTDGGSESDEASHAHAHAVRGVHERDENGERPGRGRRAGRKLWEVVDSVRLLDGVL